MAGRAFTWLLLTGLLLAAAWPLLRPYQVRGHSAYIDLSRAEAFHAAVQNGDRTPRWLPDFYRRHGSPIFNFYAPLTYYAIECFRQLGASGLWALKLAYLFFWILAVIGMLRLAGALFDPAAASAGAAIYSVSPYLLTDLYVRHGIAEFAAFGVLPWLLLSLFRLIREPRWWSPLATATAFAALILTHNITAMIFVPLLAAFAALAAKDRRGLARGLAALAGGIVLAAFFWLPAMAEMKYTHAEASLTGGINHFSNHFLFLDQLFERKWAFGSSLPGRGDGMGFMFGETLWISLLWLLLLFLQPKTRRLLREFRLALLCATASLGCLLLTLSLTQRLWDLLPLISFVQFPWRFLLPATFFGALCLPAGLAALPAKYRTVGAWIFVLVAFTASRQFMEARYTFHNMETHAVMTNMTAPEAKEADRNPIYQRPDKMLAIENIRLNLITSTTFHDYLPRWVNPAALPRETPETVVARSDGVEVLSSEWGKPWLAARIRVEAEQTVRFHHFYFPGWQATIDGRETTPGIEAETGRMTLAIPPGEHELHLEFTDTPVRVWSKIISALSLLSLTGWSAWSIRRRKT